MSKRVVHEWVDDLDGSIVPEDKVSTVRFGLDGKAYEIDLSDANAAELRAALDRYISAARRATTTSSSTTAHTTPRKRPRNPANARIREWAAANGVEAPQRGRIPAEIVDAFHAAHPST